jgi:hypothetical protein
MQSLVKQILAITFLIGFVRVISFAQTTESLVANIKTEYKETREHLSSYDTIIKDIWDESTEGGEAIGYYAKGNLKLIEVLLLREQGMIKSEYYFDADELFFCFEDFTLNTIVHIITTQYGQRK